MTGRVGTELTLFIVTGCAAAVVTQPVAGKAARIVVNG